LAKKRKVILRKGKGEREKRPKGEAKRLDKYERSSKEGSFTSIKTPGSERKSGKILEKKEKEKAQKLGKTSGTPRVS